MSKTDYGKQKKKTWDAFSQYIRHRDLLRWGKADDLIPCVTCNRRYPLKSLQAGHFVQGRGNAILFDERGVYSQCYGCNCGKKGNVIPYYKFMLKEWGQEVIDELEAIALTEVKFTIVDLREKEVYYKLKTREFKMTLNIWD